ncbi:unnamed protein product [Pedinophyceae sp. YPF-701]|nr:unnamed protein product [Pedinophyceae sp. YPF-701]
MLQLEGLAVVVGAALVWVFQDRADACVQAVWDLMRTRSFVRHETFEPVVSVASFAVWHAQWFVWDMVLPRTFTQQFSIQPKADFDHWRFKRGETLWNEALWYIVPLALFDRLYPRRALPETAPSAFGLALEIVSMLVMYDVLFFAAHLALHTVRPLYRTVHAKHHRLKHVRATEAVRLSPAEEVLDVACSIAAVNTLGFRRCHPLSRALYDVTITYLITELHSGYDTPWMWSNIIPGGLWHGSPHHCEHHLTGRHYFAKFCGFLDTIAGTVPAKPLSHPLLAAAPARTHGVMLHAPVGKTVSPYDAHPTPKEHVY